MPRKPAVRDRKTSLRERASSQAASWSLLVALDNLAKLLPQPDLAPEGKYVKIARKHAKKIDPSDTVLVAHFTGVFAHEADHSAAGL